jgi:hypothetical protein
MRQRERIWTLSLLGFHGLLISFILGTVTLIGPVRWITRVTRRLHWTQGAENALVIGVILLLVLVSFVAARVLMRLMAHVSRATAAAMSLLTVVAASAALGLWMNPVWVVSHMGAEVKAGDRFTFGPYPTEAHMGALKAEGYTAIISLLHPAVLPFEPTLIADELHAAERVGLKFIHVPMVPWISGNDEALVRLAAIAGTPGGRYYVHCYLGQDRVQMARAVVERSGPDIRVAKRQAPASFRKVTQYERGAMYELENEVFLVPFPTDEEFVAIVGAARTVVSLLDPRDPNDRPWLDRERSLLARYGTTLVELPMATGDDDPARALEIVRSVRRLPRPVVVHSFLSPSTGRAPASQAFMQAYLTAR